MDTSLLPKESCLVPICNCNIEDRVVQDFIRKYKEKQTNREPVCLSDIKKQLSKELSPDEIQAFTPFVFDKVNARYCYRESDPRMFDTMYRTSTKSTLTDMLPLKLIPEKKREPDWANFQDDSPRVLSYKDPDKKKIQSMMSRFKAETFGKIK
ncbi:hypothetical protein O3M35_012678 [Rhynocoris fuscipes]|uniref:Uncharacterized protein n=1 Tax=Rhynocoris fuscipes TaxID=488301 RepID=A0AAW1CX19_9HEMI